MIFYELSLWAAPEGRNGSM